MTIAKFGQLLMPRLEVEKFTEDRDYAETIRSYVAKFGVGGFCVFGGTTTTVATTVAELNALATSSGIPKLLWSCDCENGLPMRFHGGGTEFPDAMALARAAKKSCSSEITFRVAQAIGKEMAVLGLNWNFAPVVDINSNPRNPIINTRSFGEDVATVNDNAVAYLAGLRSAAILSTAKHFPGHGDTAQDSHRELPYLAQNCEEFGARELLPFEAMIRNGVDSVMTAHIACPELSRELGATTDDVRLPASLSGALTLTLLRKKFGFGGLVVTDALEMKAIADNFEDAQAIRLALGAGADVLLMPPNMSVAYEALAGANTGNSALTLRTEQALAQVAKLKSSLSPRSDPALEHLSSLATEHAGLSMEVARAALEISGTIPAKLDELELLILSDSRDSAEEKGRLFAQRASQLFRNTRHLTFEQASGITLESNSVVVRIHKARGIIGGADLALQAKTVMKNLLEQSASHLTGLVLIGSPYLEVEAHPEFELRTYSEAQSSITAALQCLEYRS